jgi:HSP20 family protein
MAGSPYKMLVINAKNKHFVFGTEFALQYSKYKKFIVRRMNMLALRNPFNTLRVLDSLRKEEDVFSSIVNDLFHFHGFSPLAGIDNPAFSPAIDLVDKTDRYCVSVELPGIEKDKVQIEINDDLLILKGEKTSEKEEKNEERYVKERCYGAFRREITLPSNSDKEKIDAEYKDGVLLISIPKIIEIEKEKALKKIPVK